jgi:D-alanyl-D-alanine carboxypeptidase/D-alanyl-D-alanine-endopeptidase (penicillin-binding protein 4)
MRRRIATVPALLAVAWMGQAPPLRAAVAPGKVSVPAPAAKDADRDRIVRMQEALREILHNGVMRRVRVGMRVMEARTGRLFFEQRGTVLMDPASNQKVLATTTALMRLGSDWRFRTELTGPAPNASGVIPGDVILRGSGDPTVRTSDLEAMAADLARRGVTRIEGSVIADPRRIGTDEAAPDAGEDQDDETIYADETGEAPLRGLPPRAPLVVNHGILLIRVRPAAQVGAPAEVTTNPSDRSFVIENFVRTRAAGKARPRVSVHLGLVGGRIRVELSGRIAVGHAGLAFRRRVPNQALYAAVLQRVALEGAGIAVRDLARVSDRPRSTAAAPAVLLERHESVALGVLLRKINKDSDNDYAERVLDSAGAEVYGGAPTPAKGVRLLREVIGELGLPPGSYLPRNGSGLGHANRITADAMADLLRALYLDPRIGPEILQSLSVGGVDGTTRNRFKGTLAARRVRAKTGTLNGKSCLSGLVGDGQDVLVFSILVEGLRGRSLPAVRGAQVGCVNAMMRYVREARGERLDLPSDNSQAPSVPDYELGQELTATEGDTVEPPPIGGIDPVNPYLRKQPGESAPKPGAAPSVTKPSVVKSPVVGPLPAAGKATSAPARASLKR